MAHFPAVPASGNVIDVTVDASATIALLQYGGKQLDYGIVNAINSTAKVVQTRMRERARGIFHTRTAFLEREVAIIKPFANVAAGRFYATISVGQKQRSLLPIYETGGERPVSSGASSAAVPVTGTAARPTIMTPQPFPPLIRQLGFRPQPKAGSKRARRQFTAARRQQVFEGQQHTFMIARGVFQHLGHGLLQALYIFVRHIRLRPTLQFERTARTVIDTEFPKQMRAEVDAAFKYHTEHA